MAIVYTTGTINQPDAGSVGLSMVERIRDDVVAHSAWELVEEFTPSGGAVRWYVLKCLAASSGLPDDFFVVIGRTLSNGELRAFICEEYNSSSHIAGAYPPTGPSQQVPFDSQGRLPASATITLGTAIGGTAAGVTGKLHTWIPSGTSTKWWITVDDDGFTVAFNGPTNGFFHFGAYVPLSDVPALMPLIMFGSSDSAGYLTQNPVVADAVSVYTTALIVDGGGGSSSGNGVPLGFPGSLRYNDALQSGQRPVAEQGITVQYYSSEADKAAHGWALGKQKRMRIGMNGTAMPGFAFGDAYVLQNRLWVPYRPDDVRLWDTGVAAS